MVRDPAPRDGGAAAAARDLTRPRPDHLVTFYEHASYLTASVRPFLLAGLERGETILVVATAEHRTAFARAVTASGHDLEHSRRAGHYVELDAADSLAGLLTQEGLPPARFDRRVARPVTEMAQNPQGLRVYGEMASLLWQRGDLDLALELEDRWNDLLRRVPMRLFCGQPLSAFDTAQTTARFHDMCARHTVVTTDSYGSLSVTGAATDPVVMLDAGAPGGSRN